MATRIKQKGSKSKRELSEAPPSAEITSVETQRESPKRTVSIFVKLFVIWQIFVTVVWTLPNPTPPVLNGQTPATGSDTLLLANNKYLKSQPPIAGYLMATGTWQYWDMFAPDPAQTDVWGDAVITFRDGTTMVYQYPRMYELDVFQKYLKERYRKFYERAHSEDYAFLWPTFAQHIAESQYKSKQNPPVRVSLQRHWQAVRRPSQKVDPPYNSYRYYTHIVDLNDLEAGGVQR